ncbi:MAG: Wadjet anti-phage system protein JetD domain-containing protein [Limisphaerales bacterium]
MKPHSPVLQSLARLYAESKAGRTGAGQRDFLVDLKKLLTDAGCQDGDDRCTAIRQLKELDGSLLHLEGPRRDPDIIHQVRFPPANEAKLFALLESPSPAGRREILAKQFSEASRVEVPEGWRGSWQKFCGDLAEAALRGNAIAPFSRDDLEGNAELLALVPLLLAWQQKGEESLLRFASCVLTGNSKRLGDLAAEDSHGRHTGKLGAILDRVTGGNLQCLEDVGISQWPRFVLVHGPLRLLLQDEWLNLGMLRGPVRLSDTDIHRASQIETSALRCLTVENETSFHELAKLESGELLVCTSYPGSATLAFLKKLPSTLEFWHFGDSDPEGFDILRDLRERSSRPFQSLHMRWRFAASGEPLEPSERRLLKTLVGSASMQTEQECLRRIIDEGTKGNFEQESLGKPQRRNWPFYD